MFRSVSRASKVFCKLMLSGSCRADALGIGGHGGYKLLGKQANKTVLASKQDPNETIIVTGSRGKERTVTTSATPIDVLKGLAIQKQAGQGRKCPGCAGHLDSILY